MIKIDVKLQNRVIEHYSFDKKTVTIGRDPGCDVRVDNPLLSRRHAQITAEGDDVFLEDLGSTNGVYLHNQKISKAPLRDGDEFRIDKFSFHVKLGEAAPEQKKKEFAFDIMGTMQVDARALQERLKKEAAPAAAAASPAASAVHPAAAPATARSSTAVWIALAGGLAAGFIAGYLARGLS